MSRESRAFLARLRPYAGAYAVGAAALVVADSGQLAIGHVIGRLVDGLQAGTADRASLTALAATIVAVAGLVAVSRAIWRTTLFGSARRVERRLRQDLYEHFLAMAPSFYLKRGVGELMAYGTNDVAAIEVGASLGVLASLDAVIQFAGAAGMMAFTVDARLAVLSLLPLVALTPATYLLGRRLHVAYGSVQERFASLTERTQETVSGIRVVKGFAREAESQLRFERANVGYFDSFSRMLRYDAAFDPLIGLLAGLAFAVGLGYGGTLVVEGSISLGDYIAFNTYLAMLVWPMLAIGWVTNILQRAAASMARLDELLDTPPAVRDQPGAVRLSRASGHIRIRQLTFRYDEAGPVALDKVDLEAPPGVTVGVLGRTGSGKSTLAQLLVRVFDPPPESVHLDGVDITTVRLADLRRSIAYVPQDAFLFSRTIAENIALGAATCTADDVRRAARAADLEDDIAALPFAYDTLVGERGVTLSGGQRQRVAIARALVRNAPVLLLDDCLSAVDTATEARILEALRALSADRTTIVISHRVSALRHADEILVLEAGRVVERGRHDDLVAFGGVYARTYERQQLEVALEGPATVGSPR